MKQRDGWVSVEMSLRDIATLTGILGTVGAVQSWPVVAGKSLLAFRLGPEGPFHVENTQAGLALEARCASAEQAATVTRNLETYGFRVYADNENAAHIRLLFPYA
jgi:hypothetical protein